MFTIINELPPETVGQLYLASDPENRKYALKSLNFVKKIDKEDIALEREHPSIVEYIDKVNFGGREYHVLEFCTEGDLENYLANNIGYEIPQSKIIAYAMNIIEGLNYMHMHGIIHGNLKPSNIYLQRDEQGISAKIGDFGLACNEQELNSVYGKGQVLYMAPELIQKKRCDERVDLWSLGCIMYLMCTKHHPFETLNYDQLKDSILQKNVPKLPNNYNAYMQDFIETLLEKEPENRPFANVLLKVPYLNQCNDDL